MARLTPEQLEQQIHAVLRSQPPRRAPRSLETRVLAELARRQALPWWQQSFAQWPLPMRVAFLISSLVLAGLAVLASAQAAGVISAAEHNAFLLPARDFFASMQAMGSTLSGLVARLMPQVSTFWIYAGLAGMGALYATLIGLGATAYRFIWQQR